VSTTFVPTKEQEIILTTKVQELGLTFEDPTARILHDRGFSDLAVALDMCSKRKVGDGYNCGYSNNFHTVRCRKPTCRSCMTYTAKELTERFFRDLKPLIQLLPDFWLTWTEMHIPCPRLPEAIKYQIEECKRSLLSLYSGALDAYNSKRCVNMIRAIEDNVESGLTLQREFISFFAGYTDKGEAVVRQLAIGYDRFQTIDEIKSAFPYASWIRVSHCNIQQLERFLRFTFAPEIPKSFELQADMCISLAGVRRLEYLGETRRRHRKQNVAAPQGEEFAPDLTIPEMPTSKSPSNHNAEMLLTDNPSNATSPQENPPDPPPIPSIPVKTCPFCSALHIGKVYLDVHESSSRVHPLRR
jgi:hypothetical protein